MSGQVEALVQTSTPHLKQISFSIRIFIRLNEEAHYNIALCHKSNGSYDIKDFGTLSLIFSTSKYFRRKCQPCPSFFLHPNIPDK